MAQQEDFGYMIKKEGQKSGSYGLKSLKIVILLLSVISFVLLTLSAYYFTKDEDGKIEIIHAPAFEIKTVESHSNLAIKNLDKTVYNNIVDNENDDLRTSNIKVVENAEPAKVEEDKVQNFEEEEYGIPQIIPENNADKKLQDAALTNEKAVISVENKTENLPVKNDKIAVIKTDKTTVIANDKTKITATKAEKIIPVKEEKKTEKITFVREEKKIEKIIPKTDNSSASTKPVRVQLGSFSSENLSSQTWTKLANSYPSLFSGKKSFIQKVDFKGKGVLYRLQVGSFNDKVAAREFCTKFIAKTGQNNCFIVD